MATFDTLTAARDLEAAGIDRPQAEAIAKTIRDGQGELATKADVSSLKWIAGIQGAISLATFTAVLFLTSRLIP